MSNLTEASNGSSCILCGTSGAYSCHYNGKRQHSYGKGRGIKCHDLATAEFCYECDQRFSEGSTDQIWATKWERSEEFLHWIMLTNIRRLENGILEVKK
ncbi:MAG: hypothetical protein JKY80_02045 [Mariprofundaceae bacterium]|nr:hypothetical protein [Mariprofundaceae bacterium]